MDEDFICPMVWKWSEVFESLQQAWHARADSEIPEPPHMLAPNATDRSRQSRWEETVDWAKIHGFDIPHLEEHEKHYGF